MSKCFDAADSIILDGCLDTLWSNLDHLNDVSRAAKLATVLERCFDYFVNGEVDHRLKKCLSSEGVKEYFEEKLYYLVQEMSGGNPLEGPFVKCRPSIVLFLNYVCQSLGYIRHERGIFHVDEVTRSRLLEERKKECDNFDRRARKNRESMRKLFKSIYDARSKVLVLRLDLWYDFCAISTSESEGEPKFNRNSISDIDKGRKEFIKHLRDTYGGKLLGYVWRLEYGALRGYHLHFLVMLDGQYHSQDSIICRHLGEHWKTKITSHQGGYYNCNADKKAYKELAIGMTSHCDEAKSDAMEKIIRYFTKNDLLFQTSTDNERNRTFGRSALVQSPSNRGRKRVSAS